MKDSSGLSRVSQAVAEELARRATSSGERVFTLRGIYDKESLFRAIRETVPLDPPLAGDQCNWDALDDSLWSGLHGLADSSVNIVWPDAGELQGLAPEVFETAEGILAGIVQTLADPIPTCGRVKSVCVVLGGPWKENPA